MNRSERRSWSGSDPAPSRALIVARSRSTPTGRHRSSNRRTGRRRAAPRRRTCGGQHPHREPRQHTKGLRKSNAHLPETARGRIEARRNKLLGDRRTAAGFGLPVRERWDRRLTRRGDILRDSGRREPSAHLVREGHLIRKTSQVGPVTSDSESELGQPAPTTGGPLGLGRPADIARRATQASFSAPKITLASTAICTSVRT